MNSIMKKFLLFLSICISLFACKKHQDPLPDVSNGMATPTAPSDSIDYLRPKRSTFKYVGYFSPMICEYEYYPDGLLRKINKFDSLENYSTGIRDSFIFSYTNGWLTKKISYKNNYNEITTELFSYNNGSLGQASTLNTYTYINPNNSYESKTYTYYYNSNGRVSYVLATDYLTNKLIDSISIVDFTAIKFGFKGDIDPNNPNPNDPALFGYREKSVRYYFITPNGNYHNTSYAMYPDLGFVTYDATDPTHQHPIYNYGLHQLNKTTYSNISIPFQNELAINLMPDGINSFPEAAFFNNQINSAQSSNHRTYLIADDDTRYRLLTTNNNNLLFFENHYYQRIVGRGSLTPESSRTTLYF